MNQGCKKQASYLIVFTVSLEWLPVSSLNPKCHWLKRMTTPEDCIFLSCQLCDSDVVLEALPEVEAVPVNYSSITVNDNVLCSTLSGNQIEAAVSQLKCDETQALMVSLPRSLSLEVMGQFSGYSLCLTKSYLESISQVTGESS